MIWRNLGRMLYWLVSIYLLLALLAFLLQRQVIYYPTPAYPDAAIPAMEFERDGVNIHVWVQNPGQPDALIYFGGNAEDLRWQAPEFARLLPERTLYLMNYRGYGASGGRPSENAITGDALALFDAISQEHERIAVAGRSLGSGVAAFLASQRPVERLLLATPFDRLASIAHRAMPILPMALLMRDRYPAADLLRAVRVPVLVVVAGKDEIIPASSSAALIDSLDPTRTTVLHLPDAGHNTIDLFAEYPEAMRRFLAPQASRKRSGGR